MPLYFSIFKLELILLWHLKELFQEASHKGEFSYRSADYLLNYVFLLITSDRMWTLAVYFPFVKAMPGSDSDFCLKDNSGTNAFSLHIQQTRDEGTLTSSQIPTNATPGFMMPRTTQLQVSQSQQDNNCAQRKPSKNSKRNLLWDERENYYGNQLFHEKRKAVSLWENFQCWRKGGEGGDGTL